MSPEPFATATFAAMGTEVTVVAPSSRVDDARTSAAAHFAAWEATLSRFRPESDLSRLNAAGGRPFAASPILLAAVEAALGAARATGGAFDPTLLPDLERIGYDRTFETLASAPTELDPHRGGGWRGIRIDGSRIVVPAGVRLDLGGIAKGMAVDAALERLAAEGHACALVDAGGDLAVLGRPAGARGWTVAVEGVEGAWTLGHGALATSGTRRRHWLQGSRRRHHLLDPATGEPVEGDLRSVTVAAATCRQAEVAATAAFVLGAEAGAAFLHEHGIAALLVAADRTATAVSGASRLTERAA